MKKLVVSVLVLSLCLGLAAEQQTNTPLGSEKERLLELERQTKERIRSNKNWIKKFESIKVWVHLSKSDDDILNDRILSFIKRELRKLGDVELVNAGEDYGTYIVEIIAVSSGNIIAVSFIFNKVVFHYVDTGEDKPIPIREVRFESAKLILSDKNDLGLLCEEVVAFFDEELLDSARRINKRFREVPKRLIETTEEELREVQSELRMLGKADS